MKLEQSFEVNAPLDRVWEALVDVERVAPCLPGAEVTGRNEDGSYDGSFKVKIGPTAAAYTGKLHMDQIDEGSHTATMHAQGTDRRGQGGAKATIVSSVSEAGSGTTRVNVVTDYHITGRLARFGRGGMIEEISNRLLGEFAKSLQQMLAGGDGQAPTSPAAESVTPPAPEPAASAGSAGEPTSPAAESAAPAPEAAGPTPEAAAADGEPSAAAGGEPSAAAGEPPTASESAAAAELAAVVPEAAPAAQPAGEPVSAPGAPSGTPDAAGDGSPFPGATPTASEPIQGLSLVGSVAWSRLKKNPAPLVALVIGFLVALRLLRKRG
jgi:carbon monoxide dehydrogenase subunit G